VENEPGRARARKGMSNKSRLRVKPSLFLSPSLVVDYAVNRWMIAFEVLRVRPTSGDGR
jgi:hypothetical protein